MKRLGITVVGAVAVVLMGCGGGGGGGNTGAADQGVIDSGPQDATPIETGNDTGATDPGADPFEPDLIAPEVPSQDVPRDETVGSDAAKPDVFAQDPGGDMQTPSKFIVRVVQEEERPGQPEPVAGAEVAILDNETGQPTSMSGQTDAKGEVAFDLAPGLVFAVSVKKEAFIDRYYFDIPEERGSLEVGMLPVAVIEMVSQMIGLQWDSSKGIVVGRIVFQTEQGEEDVGCALVESDKGGEIRYWDPDDDMPASLDKAPMTSKENSSFLVANVPPGPVGLTAKVGGEIVASKDTISFAGGLTEIEVFATGDANPTPADCAY